MTKVDIRSRLRTARARLTENRRFFVCRADSAPQFSISRLYFFAPLCYDNKIYKEFFAQKGEPALTITEIKKTKAGRYAVFGDSAFLFSIHADTYALCGLRRGSEIDAHALEELRLSDEAYSCRQKALSLLSCAAHSRGMLIDKLCRFYPREAAEAAADRMEELGLLNDPDYGRRLACDLLRLRGWSRSRIRQELQKRRLSPEVVSAVMDTLEEDDGEGEAGRILRLLRGRYRSKLNDRRGVDNTIAALCRQGFSLTDIRQALSVLREELPEESPEEDL